MTSYVLEMGSQTDECCLGSQLIQALVIMHEKRACVKRVQIVCLLSFLDSWIWISYRASIGGDDCMNAIEQRYRNRVAKERMFCPFQNNELRRNLGFASLWKEG